MRKNESRVGKKRVGVWLEAELVQKLRAESRERGIAVQRIVESALDERYKEGSEDEGLVLRRLDLVDGRLQVQERMIEVLGEALWMFVKRWCYVTPPVRESEMEAARGRAGRLVDHFLQALTQRLQEGASLFTELPEGVVAGRQSVSGPVKK